MRHVALLTLSLAAGLGALTSFDLVAQTNLTSQFTNPPQQPQPAPIPQPSAQAQRPSRPGQGPHRPWTRAEWEERSQELRGLSPEERRQKIRSWRRERLMHRPEIRDLSPEELRQKREQLRARLEEHISELRQKQAAGTITSQEARRLGRLEELQRRFQVKPHTPREPIDKPPETKPERQPPP